MKISLDWSSADWTIKRCIIWTGQLGQIKLDWVLQIISVSDYISFLRLIFKKKKTQVLINTDLLFHWPTHHMTAVDAAELVYHRLGTLKQVNPFLAFLSSSV